MKRHASRFDATQVAKAAAVVPTVCLIGERRVGFEAASMTEAMKAFKIVPAIAAGAVEGVHG